MAGVVLAAGAGTRLRPLTELLPKALCPVGNRPLVEHALARVQPHVEATAVNIHAHTEMMREHLQGRVNLSIEEPDALGTAGALGQLRGWLDGRGVLVTNADAWLRDDLGELVGGWDGERARLLVVRDAHRGDFGPWRYAGACLLPWRLVQDLPATPAGLYEACWRHEEARGALDLCPTDALFIDCGTPRDYLDANMDWSGGENVIGPGAVVEGRVRRSVVWPGGVVRADEDLFEVIRAGSDLTVAAASTT
jgi:MurNAc alpha-1-phosphate uridylyltransferase